MKSLQLRQILIALLRVPTYLLLLVYVLLGILYGEVLQSSGIRSGFTLLLAIKAIVFMVCVGVWYINGTAINDYADYEIDLINLKNDKSRPLVTGMSSKQLLRKIAIISCLIAILLAACLGKQIFGLVTMLVILNWAYSMPPFQISHRGALAPLLLPLGYVTLPILGGMSLAGHGFSNAAAVIGALYFLFISRILLKDYRDVKGDAAHGKKTALLRYGSRKVCLASAISSTIGYVILFAAFKHYIANALIFIIFLAGIGYALLDMLSREKLWLEQRPFITSYGRTQTGVLLCVVLAFAFQLSPAANIKEFIVYIAATLLIMMSIREIVIQQSPGTKN